MVRRERLEGRGRSHFGTFLTGCLAGVVVGGLLGVILAPHRGDITRRKVARKANETRDQVVEAVEQQMDNIKAKKGIPDADQTTDN